jgi:integrase
MREGNNLKLNEWLDSSLNDFLKPLVDAGKLAHSTFVRYRGIANNHLKPALGHRKLKDLTRAEVRRLYNEKGKEFSPWSVDYIHVTRQKALSQAVRDDPIHRHVAAGERPRSSSQREEPKALFPSQARALLQAASGQRNEALYLVGATLEASFLEERPEKLIGERAYETPTRSTKPWPRKA